MLCVGGATIWPAVVCKMTTMPDFACSIIVMDLCKRLFFGGDRTSFKTFKGCIRTKVGCRTFPLIKATCCKDEPFT